jgi:UDP-N-acetylenolpyruvoylglucosamine reductase
MIQQNVNLQSYNTFRVDAIAKFFVEIDKPDDFAKLLETDVFKSQQDNLLFL